MVSSTQSKQQEKLVDHLQPAYRPFTNSARHFLLCIICLVLVAAILFNTFYFNRSQPILTRVSNPFAQSKHKHFNMSTITKKTATVIFSHGLGDSSAGWSFLSKQLGLHMPWVNWVFPDAPIQPVTLNMGARMPSWFDITGLDPSAKEDEKGLLESVRTIQSLIQKEVDSGIPTHRIVVGGFSQGGVIAILTGLMSPTPLGGAVCLSGFLPLTSKIKQLQGPHALNLKVFWGHGTDDPIVRYEWGVKSVQFLKENLGVSNLEFKSYPDLVHSASPLELKNLLDWLQNHLPNE